MSWQVTLGSAIVPEDEEKAGMERESRWGKKWGIEAKYGEQDSRQESGGMTRSEDRDRGEDNRKRRLIKKKDRETYCSGSV